LLVEADLYAATCDALTQLGHRTEQWPATGNDCFMNVSAACAVLADRTTSVLYGAADLRRPAYAIGW
jgi:gamma-glutamyltranspeptidase